jgi:hypothetical protein
VPSSVRPPGWPSDLPPPGTPEFDERVSGWLLDRCSPEVRAARTIRVHPVALAHVAQCHSEALVAGHREAYRAARRELADQIPPAAMEEILTDLEAVGHALVGALREVRLVAEALQGAVWRERL